MKDRKLALIASPYAGDVEHNIDMAKRYCRHALESGCDFIAVHLMYPQVLNDANPEERQRGIRMGLRLLAECDELWVCGDKITEGMRTEIAEAQRLGIRVVPIHLAEAQKMDNGKWGIWAQRGPSSDLGRSTAWAKADGKVMSFGTYEEAAEKADQYMKNRGIADVAYYPKEIGAAPDESQFPGMELRMT
jgi:hypothetical protein